MIYSEAIDYIRNIERGGSDYGIERMRELLAFLGSPDARLKFVHVAGTNGKGSVCAYLTSILKCAGYKVGTYNSPSVFRYNERWTVNGETLSDELVARYMSKVRAVIERENARREFHPTAFEIETAVAMLAFAEQGCDIAVLETGLGGRWDATNAIAQKELAVITPIGLDHCALLGDTLGEIAAEKAAIAENSVGRTVVTCAQCEEIMQEISRPYLIADGKKIRYAADVRICDGAQLMERSLDGQVFEYRGRIYRIGMLGEHQLQNACIAICAVEILRERDWEIPDGALEDGLESAVWHARFEIVKNAQTRFNLLVPQDKVLIFDGAHNPHGATALMKALKDYFPDGKIHMVVGMLADKDTDGVIKLLAPLACRATAVTPSSPRALDKGELKRKICKYVACNEGVSVRDAVQSALAGDCDVVVLCGSLTLFADLIEK